jgi:enolase
MKIRSIKALEILDSRGEPTIETAVSLADGSVGKAAVPSGASTGTYEACELRDGDKSRFAGRGVLRALASVEEIGESLAGREAEDQAAIDQVMVALDGTDNKSRLGANAILSVSMAVAVAQARAEKKHLYQYLTKFNPSFKGKYVLPVPLMNIINGAKHANWATDIQEYMVMPVGAKSASEAVRMGAEIYQQLKGVIKEKNYSTNLGDEGGFAPACADNDEPFELIAEAVKRANYNLGGQVVLAIDAAASEFYQDGHYQLQKSGQNLDAQGLATFYESLMAKYPIVSLEDPFAEDDWASFAKFSAAHADKQIVGDDLYVTNVKRLNQGLEQKASNAILIKLNQIGTVSETIAAINLAAEHGMRSIISHRSGETADTFIVDLAVAMSAGQLKAGAPARGERVAKYNRLLAIAEQIGQAAEYYQWR